MYFQFCSILLLAMTLTQEINCTANTPSSSEAALLIIDIQNDFCEGGSLAIPGADNIIPIINDLRSKITFSKVILTMDWHPVGHVSFYDTFSDKVKYPGAQLYHNFELDLGDGRGQRTQRLWPIHCLQNSSGAALRAALKVLPTDITVLKGTDRNVDSYSAFGNEAEGYVTEMDKVLKDSHIKELVVVGLALEYCVGETALDGALKGYKVIVLEDAVGLFHNDETEAMAQKLLKAGVKLTSTQQFLGNNAHVHKPTLLLLLSVVYFQIVSHASSTLK